MGRTVWIAFVVMVFVLCWVIIILGVSSLSVAHSVLSTDTSLSQLGPEYPFSGSVPVLDHEAPAGRHPA
jgi:hypothetical protein